MFFRSSTYKENSTKHKTKEIDMTATATQQTLVIPENEVEFALALNGDEADPIEMLQNDGINPANWEFRGKKIMGTGTRRRFKLVSVGYCTSFNKLVEKLKKQGAIPEGQWREAFKKRFPKPGEKSLIGFADASWVYPNADLYFPYFGDNGGRNSSFRWTGHGFNGVWRWVVEVSESAPSATI